MARMNAKIRTWFREDILLLAEAYFFFGTFGLSLPFGRNDEPRDQRYHRGDKPVPGRPCQVGPLCTHLDDMVAGGHGQRPDDRATADDLDAAADGPVASRPNSRGVWSCGCRARGGSDRVFCEKPFRRQQSTARVHRNIALALGGLQVRRSRSDRHRGGSISYRSMGNPPWGWAL